MKQFLEAEIDAFLSQVGNMTAEDFDVVSDYALEHLVEQKPARTLSKLGAADFSWLDKRVRETVGPLIGHLDWSSASVRSMSVAVVLTTAQAIVRRDRLSAEQYEAFVGGFRSVGVVVPDHPSAESS